MDATIETRRESLEALHRSINKIQSRREKLIDSDAPKREVERLDDELTKAYEQLEQETVPSKAKPRKVIYGPRNLPPQTIEEVSPVEEQFVREALDGIKRIMDAEGVSQRDLANLLGINQSSVSTAINMENKSSRWRGLKITTLARIYDALGYELHIQVTRQDEEEKVKWHNQ